ncbi:MAG: HAMP domain-containing histidine kinase, partial [Bacteroidales bacterium]|nr:HAMP domain-containing histidine kinase [Bacteroidales bacterium]
VYKLLENLLDWSRIQLGGIEFHPEPVDLRRIVMEILNVDKLSREKKEIRVISDIPENLIVFADENMVKTILRNLVTNAVKFSAIGGSIRISVIPSSELDQIQTGFIGIAVTDYGIGISEENLDSLFKIDSGFRMKGTSNETGTGLGLVLCKEFVDAHGGTIWVESEVGKGSAFIFTIPLS